MHYLEILIVPVVAMMGLGFLYSAILRRFNGSGWAPIAFGMLFGAATLVAMTFPIELGDGIIIDLRSLLVGLCVVFSGWVAGLLAVGIGLIYRVYIGGSGLLAGVVGLVTVYALAVFWLYKYKGRLQEGLVSDAAFGLLMSLGLLAIFVLPYDVAVRVLSEITGPIVTANMIGSMALGYVFRREAKYVRDAEQLRVYASIDPLTNLLNRRGTEGRMAELTEDVGEGRVLLYFDIDKFKQVNDTHGHAAGDAVLAAVAARVEASVRGKAIFSRHGGDEFTLVVPDVTYDAIRQIADRICEVVGKTPIQFQGRIIEITVSVGGFWTNRHATFEEMLSGADHELLNAKALGRDCACIRIDPGATADAQMALPMVVGQR